MIDIIIKKILVFVNYARKNMKIALFTKSIVMIMMLIVLYVFVGRITSKGQE